MRTTLSVILPVRNGERHLGACLDSISLQKNDSMEILVLDDGSTDSTAALAEEKAKNDPRIRLIRKPNSGYGDTMNRGLELAKGKYVAFAESDDELLPDGPRQFFGDQAAHHVGTIARGLRHHDGHGPLRP